MNSFAWNIFLAIAFITRICTTHEFALINAIMVIPREDALLTDRFTHCTNIPSPEKGSIGGMQQTTAWTVILNLTQY